MGNSRYARFRGARLFITRLSLVVGIIQLLAFVSSVGIVVPQGGDILILSDMFLWSTVLK